MNEVIVRNLSYLIVMRNESKKIWCRLQEFWRNTANSKSSNFPFCMSDAIEVSLCEIEVLV